jgi:hypothetical protein
MVPPILIVLTYSDDFNVHLAQQIFPEYVENKRLIPGSPEHESTSDK